MSKKLTYAQQLKETLEILLPPGNTYIPAVPEHRQAELLESLNNNITNESFYFVFNLLKCRLENVHGVEKWLGYSVKEFTVSKYLNIIHGAQAIQHNILAHNMYKILCSGTFRLNFSTQRYISLLGLKPYNDEYILFKKTTSVFQYDTNNRLLAQLNIFEKIDDYENSPLKPRITEQAGAQKNDFEKMVFKMTMEHFMEGKFFSNTEFSVLALYVSGENITSKMIAEALKIDVTTVNTYNKRILEKARKTFTTSFNNAREVAQYLKKERIL